MLRTNEYYEEGQGSAIRARRFRLKEKGIEFPGAKLNR